MHVTVTMTRILEEAFENSVLYLTIIHIIHMLYVDIKQISNFIGGLGTRSTGSEKMKDIYKLQENIKKLGF